MDFTFSEEQEMFRRMMHDFAQKELAPALKRRAESAPFPQDLMTKMADIGLLGMAISEEYGGQPTDQVTRGIAEEELGKADFNAAFIILITRALLSSTTPPNFVLIPYPEWFLLVARPRGKICTELPSTD